MAHGEGGGGGGCGGIEYGTCLHASPPHHLTVQFGHADVRRLDLRKISLQWLRGRAVIPSELEKSVNWQIALHSPKKKDFLAGKVVRHDRRTNTVDVRMMQSADSAHAPPREGKEGKGGGKGGGKGKGRVLRGVDLSAEHVRWLKSSQHGQTQLGRPTLVGRTPPPRRDQGIGLRVGILDRLSGVYSIGTIIAESEIEGRRHFKILFTNCSIEWLECCGEIEFLGHACIFCPEETNGIPAFIPVVCGALRGQFFLGRLKVLHNGALLTPAQFEARAGYAPITQGEGGKGKGKGEGEGEGEMGGMGSWRHSIRVWVEEDGTEASRKITSIGQVLDAIGVRRVQARRFDEDGEGEEGEEGWGGEEMGGVARVKERDKERVKGMERGRKDVLYESETETATDSERGAPVK